MFLHILSGSCCRCLSLESAGGENENFVLEDMHPRQPLKLIKWSSGALCAKTVMSNYEAHHSGGVWIIFLHFACILRSDYVDTLLKDPSTRSKFQMYFQRLRWQHVVSAGFYPLLAASGISTVIWHGQTLASSKRRPHSCIILDDTGRRHPMPNIHLKLVVWVNPRETFTALLVSIKLAS